MPTTLALGAVGIGGALITAKASKDAAKLQTDAANRATDIQEQALTRSEAELRPYSDVGKSAAYTLADFYGLDRGGAGGGGPAISDASLAAFRRSPDYQFALREGVRAGDQSAINRGLLHSGKRQKALTSFASNLASSNIGGYLNRLYQLAGLGADAGARSGAGALSTARGMADTTLGAGEAAASGVVGASNAWTRGIGDTVDNLTLLRGLRGGSSYTPSTTNFGRAIPSFIY